MAKASLVGTGVLLHPPTGGCSATNKKIGYLAVQQIPGIGPALAAVFVAEIGEVTRLRFVK